MKILACVLAICLGLAPIANAQTQAPKTTSHHHAQKTTPHHQTQTPKTTPPPPTDYATMIGTAPAPAIPLVAGGAIAYSEPGTGPLGQAYVTRGMVPGTAFSALAQAGGYTLSPSKKLVGPDVGAFSSLATADGYTLSPSKKLVGPDVGAFSSLATADGYSLPASKNMAGNDPAQFSSLATAGGYSLPASKNMAGNDPAQFSSLATAGGYSLPASKNIVGTTDAQTLTNKTLPGRPFDIRNAPYSAPCTSNTSGVADTTAFNSAVAAGNNNIFLGTGCTLLGGTLTTLDTIPAGVNIDGQDWQLSQIQSSGPTTTNVKLAPNASVRNVNIIGQFCYNGAGPANASRWCPTKGIANGGGTTIVINSFPGDYGEFYSGLPTYNGVTQTQGAGPRGLAIVTTSADGLYVANSGAGSDGIRTVTSGLGQAMLEFQYTTDNVGVTHQFIKARGTQGTPAVVSGGDFIANIQFFAYDGTNYINSGAIVSQAVGAISTGVAPNNTTIQVANNSGVLKNGLSVNGAASGGGQIVVNGNMLSDFAGNTNAFAAYQLNGTMMASATALTIASGGCTAPVVANANGTVAWKITIGTACSGSQPLVLTLPAAAHGWACRAEDITTPAQVHQTALATNSATLTDYPLAGGAAQAWTAGDVVVGTCTGF